MTAEPLGDQAILVRPGDEVAAFAWGEAARHSAPTWLHDVVVAYAAVAVHFDADRVTLADVLAWAHSLSVGASRPEESPAVVIPVCYERQLDLGRVVAFTGLPAEAVIAAHSGTPYTVYAVGFVPGFPYLGYLPDALQGVPRRSSPRLRVEPGSVGLTGRQTGVYPLPRPGGWSLIGRTPLTLVDVAAGYFPLRVGTAVSFARIDEAEFTRLDGTRLGG